MIIATSLILYVVYASRKHKLDSTYKSVLGAKVLAETDLNPKGVILINGQAWIVISSEIVKKGTLVEVIETDEVFLRVKPVFSTIFSANE
ncbi:MAG: NfeD family protein [Blastocatellia bacterium]